jgi:hypothetical protein
LRRRYSPAALAGWFDLSSADIKRKSLPKSTIWRRAAIVPGCQGRPQSAVLRRSLAGTKLKVSIIRFVAAGRAFVAVFGVADALQNNNSRL